MTAERTGGRHAQAIRRTEVFYAYLLRHTRRRHGMSQVELAARCGYTPSYISTAESGQVFANITRSHHLARTLGVDPDCLHRCAGLASTLLERHGDAID